jgi:hypothetical protein
MSDEITLTIDTREMERALKALTQRAARSAMGAGLQAAGNVMLDAVVAHTPERTGEETPEQTSLPPGILKADMHTEIQFSRKYGNGRVKVGPSRAIGGLVAYRQNNGWILTAHGGKTKGGGRKIRSIAAKHFLESAFDESSQTAVDMFLATLADNLFADENADEGVGLDQNNGGENY